MNTINELIEKYNRPGPRYTSYPPVPYWQGTPDEVTWINHLNTSYDPEKGIDLYVHVPFCESLCYYCGCSRIITKDHSVEKRYLAMVIKEWALYEERLGFTPNINSLHFGGGTPTFLSAAHLDLLIKTLTKNKLPQFIGSIEIDPRTCQTDHLDVLAKNGITRVSLGIQDFDPIVQEAIHRHQSPEMVKLLVEKIRERGINSINFDLIYGLPKQSLNSISGTIETVIKLNPELIAFYSYAHLPEKIKNQRLINDSDLPSPKLKRELYELGKKLLQENGYHDVGMDHFAKPGSYLYQAKKEDNLHRNFMGYVDKKSPILLGLGPTSISDSSLSFIQNIKDVKSYEDKVNANQLPIQKGHVHSKNDLMVQDIILELMCRNETTLNDTSLPYWDDVFKELKDFEADGILELEHNKLKLSELGKVFVRNVAMSFDFHLREQRTAVKFSQTI